MFMALNVVSGILCRRCKQPGHVARECVQAWIQPRPPAPLASDPVVPDVSSKEEEDLSSVSSEVVEPRPPSPLDPVPPAPSSPPVPSASSSTSASSSLSPDQIALKRLICQSLPSRLIVRLPGVLLRLINSSMVSCPSRLSLSASVILLSPMFRVLFMFTRKRLLMPVKVNVRKFCICVEFTV